MLRIARQGSDRGSGSAPAIVPAPRLAPTDASRRWAALIQQIFEVDPLACPATAKRWTERLSANNMLDASSAATGVSWPAPFAAALVLEVVHEVDRGHTADREFTVDAVARTGRW